MLLTVDKILAQKVSSSGYNLYVVLPNFLVKQHTNLPYTIQFTISDITGVEPDETFIISNTFIKRDHNVVATNFNIAVSVLYENNASFTANQSFDFTAENIVDTIVDISIIDITIKGHIVSYMDTTKVISLVYVQQKDNLEFPFKPLKKIISDLQTDLEYIFHFIDYDTTTNIITYHVLNNFTFAKYLAPGIRVGIIDILEDISDKINIRGFEALDYSTIQSTFDSVKNEHKVQLIRSDIDRLHWKPNISNSYMLDLDYYTVYGSDNKLIESFGKYDKDLRQFVLEDDKNGIYYVVGLWANIYDVMAELWDIRASNRVDSISTRAGTAAIKFEQEFNHCIKMRDYYKGLIARSLSW